VATGASKLVDLERAVADNVVPGDVVHVMVGHTRWTAATRALARHFWGRDPGFTLCMLSLSSLGAVLFRGGLVRKVITGYSGDTFPNFTPNPVFARAYASGEVEVEHWSFLTFAQRLECAARGLPAVVTRSLGGSSMAGNEAYARVSSPFGELGVLAPLVPDVALLHGVVADADGNVALNPPLLEGVWGALAARRGAVVTVERVVEDIRPWAHLVLLPAHRVLAVAETPMGAHPGGLYAADLPVDAYGEDYEFWVQARAASRGDQFDEWIRHWVREPATQEEYLARLGDERITALRRKADPSSWKAERDAMRPDVSGPPNSWEVAAVHGARRIAQSVRTTAAHAVLAGAGVANLAAWLGVAQAREAGSGVQLVAELGLWGYEPRPADPYVFNHRNFPTATMATDTSAVLGMLVGGAGTSTVACLGAAQFDRWGSINSTIIPGGPFLVGSGGGNDVASGCSDAVIVATLTPARTPEKLGYVTSPGDRVSAVATDLGLLEKAGGDELELTAVTSGPAPLRERIEVARAACGWGLEVADSVAELPPPTAEELLALRSWDPHGWFLRARA
jgi:acyl CoA:acetate/3-ketoacid CoA transferase alpha subunit/acyl CoA:acetate/3-ketoacid CoA transferase beta subunit